MKQFLKLTMKKVNASDKYIFNIFLSYTIQNAFTKVHVEGFIKRDNGQFNG